MNTERTFVPPEMMREGWTAENPQTRDNWDVERDVFMWLSFRDTAIEDVIAMYQRWLDEVEKKGFFARLRTIAHWRCQHKVNIPPARCAICESQWRECITYLNELKANIGRQKSAQVDIAKIPDDPYDREARETEERSMTLQEANEIIRAFTDLMGTEKVKGLVLDASLLPTTKERMKEAFLVALANPPTETFANAPTELYRQWLRDGYLWLSYFQAGVGSKGLDPVHSSVSEFGHWTSKVTEEIQALEDELRAHGY